MAGERCGLGSHTFHHVSVTAYGVHVVVEKLEAGTIVILREPICRNGHADAIADSLSQGAGCGFHSSGQAVFGMSWRLAVNLPKMLDVIEANGVLVQSLVVCVYSPNFRQVEQGVKKH